MDVQVVNGLACSRASINAQVVAIRSEPAIKNQLDLSRQFHQSCLLACRGIPPGWDYPVRDNQCVAFSNRESVEDGKTNIVGGNPLSLGNLGKR